MKLWFAIPFGAVMLARPIIAEWFIFSCVTLVMIFATIAGARRI